MPAFPPEPRRSRTDLLADVQRRGRFLRRRRKFVTAVSALAVAALVFGVAGQLTTSGRSGVQVMTADEGHASGATPDATPTTGPVVAGIFSTTTSGPAGNGLPSSTTATSPEVSSASRRPGTPLSTTTSSTAPPVSTTTSPSTTTSNTTATTAPSTTSTTELVCWQSYDPRCGEFRWAPAPTVDPMTASASVVTATPKAGQPVLFKLVADDPDTAVEPCLPANWGDGSPEAVCNGGTYACHDEQQATGPWPPPEKKPGHMESNEGSTHTYDKPGTYTATFYFWTGFPGCPSPWDKDPYRNKTTANVTFTVQP